MLKEFKAFINRGNVMDLAVAVIIGAAFGKIVTSLTDDIIMPMIGKIFGGLDFSGYFLRLGPIPADYAGSAASYADLKKAGVPLLGYGAFATQVVNFVIVAFIIFMLLRAVNKAITAFEHEKAQADADARATPVPDSAEVLLLRDIRDELRGRGADPSARVLPLDGQ
jgi:large conductance mechanosensitive channel